ncbi:MAG TPA: AAA family ATPase, partial [Thermoplasmata archaeon]|nr:AAA family ATPase [Thermoplasmata archaeon]
MIASRGFRRSPVAPLFGREEILEEAHRALDRAKGGAGAGLLLMGPGGVGKTQLLHAIVERAGRRGFTVLTGRALPEELPPAFSLVRELLASERAAGSSSASTPWTPPGTRRGGPMAGEGGEAAGGLQARSPSATASADLEALIPARLSRPEPAESRREELFAQIEKDLLDRSENSPLLIAVDDMHFADNSSLDFFCRFAGKLAGSHITLVATVAELPDLPERTRSAIETLSGVSGVLSMPIRPLNFLETEEFVRWILGGRSPDRNDVRRWHAQTDGNPLFIEQLVRTATGLTGPPKGSEGDAQAVTEILFERVKGQADRERRVLTYAAVLGKEFQFASLSAVLAMGEEAVTESLDRLVHDGLIREKGGEVYEFVSEAVRRDLYASLTETRRRILHARAGSALEGKPGTSDSELARHFYLGREEAKAVEYNVKAARGAARDLDFLTATLLIGRALEAERRRPEPEPRVEIRLLTEQGRLLEEIGVLPPSDELLTEAVTIGRKAVDAELELGRALLGLAQTRTTRSEYESAESLATEALERLEKVG